MRATWVLYRRELSAIAGTPMGWLLFAGFTGLSGLFWVAMFDRFIVAARDEIYDPFTAAQMNPVDHLLGPWLANTAIVVLVLAPALTMRMVADEARRGTLDLLLNSPLSSASIVLAKAGAAWTWLVVMLAAAFTLPATLVTWDAADPGALAAAGLGMALFAAATAAIGLLASTATEHAAAAFATAFAASLVLWIVGFVDPDPTSLTAQISLGAHLQDLVRGAVRLSDVGYYLLVTATSLFAAARRLDAWRYL